MSTLDTLPCGSHGAGRWYVLELHPGADHVTLAELTKPTRANGRVWAAWMPEVLARKGVPGGGSALVREPMFPGYLLVRLDLARDPWQRLNSVPGVKALVWRERPQPLRDDEVQGFVDRAADVEKQLRGKLQLPARDEPVRVVAGAWNGFEGVCLWSRKDRIKLLLSVFGKDTKVELPLRQTERIET